MPVMSILEGISDLLDVAKDGGQRKGNPFGMPIAHGATRRIVHDQKGSLAFDPEVEDAHDMRMHEARNDASLFAKGDHLLTCQARME